MFRKSFVCLLVSVFLVFTFSGSALAKKCQACPYSCKTLNLSKSVCKDWKGKKGKCCVERKDGKMLAGTHCNTERRCTKAERRNRGCKDFKNEKGQSCISFQR